MASLLSLISLPLEIQHLPQGLSPRPPCPHISLVHPADVIFLPNKHGLCLCLPDSTSDFLTCSVVSYAHGSCPRWSARSPRLPTPFGIFHLPFAFPSHLLIYWVPPPARMCPPSGQGLLCFIHSRALRSWRNPWHGHPPSMFAQGMNDTHVLEAGAFRLTSSLPVFTNRWIGHSHAHSLCAAPGCIYSLKAELSGCKRGLQSLKCSLSGALQKQVTDSWVRCYVPSTWAHTAPGSILDSIASAAGGAVSLLSLSGHNFV